MIITDVIITCDSCGRNITDRRSMEFRTSGDAPRLIKILKEKGWEFQRDDDYRLLKVLCPECRKNML